MKALRGVVAGLFVVVLALGTTGCSKTEEEAAPTTERSTKVKVSVEPVEIIQAIPPPAAVMANYATTLAVNQYVRARLLTDLVTATDFDKVGADELGDTVVDALIAWDDTEEVCAEAAGVTAIAETELVGVSAKTADEEVSGEEDLDEEDSGGTSDRRSSERRTSDRRSSDRRSSDRRSRGTQVETEWTTPFSDFFDPIEVVQAQSSLIEDMDDDAYYILDALEEMDDIVSGASLSDADLADIEEIAEDINRLAQVDLQVTSAALPEGGSIKALSGSEVRGRSNDRVILTGVDAVAAVGDRQSSLMVGANNQVVIEEDDLPTDGSEVDVVFGIVDLTPETSPNKDVSNTALPIGRTPGKWFVSDTLISIQVTNIDAEATLVVAGIPLGNDDEVEDFLTGLNVPTEPAPDTSLDALADRIGIDGAQAAEAIRDALDQLEPRPERTTSDEREARQGEPAQQEPTDVPEGGTPALEVQGTYDWTMQSDVSEPPRNSGGKVSLSGETMTVTLGGNVYSGPYDYAMRTFTCTSNNSGLTLEFLAQDGVVAAEGAEHFGVIKMWKTGP